MKGLITVLCLKEKKEMKSLFFSKPRKLLNGQSELLSK